MRARPVPAGDPHGWRRRPIGRAAPAPLRDWLCDRGSLTARLQRLGRFSLRLLADHSARPTPDEAPLLGLRATALARIREVVLTVEDVPLVFAHSTLPRASRGLLARWLSRLGARSLGSMLFRHPGVRRGPLRCRALDRRHPLHRHAVEALALPPATRLWARRSRFDLHRQSILVTEIFSPALVARAAVTKTPQKRSPGIAIG